jgi:nucleoside-diphosphate-sugar epimerase
MNTSDGWPGAHRRNDRKIARVRALVTGANGFIGANLVRRLLDRGDDVHAVSRPGSDGWRLTGVDGALHHVDLTDAAAVAALVAAVRPDSVFHLAAHGAYSWQSDTERIFATNLGATVNLLGACREGGVASFVHAGSSSEYGYKDHAPGEEEAPEPNSDYAVAKAAATMYCQLIDRESDMCAVTLRLYSIYGPWEEANRLVPRLVIEGLDGRLPALVDPDVARDFVYVEDAVDAFLLAAEADHPRPGAVYNIAGGAQTTIGDLVATTRELLEIDAEPQWGSMERRGWDTSVWIGDPARAAEELGWQPRHDLGQGISRTVEWFRAEGAELDAYRPRD